MGADHGSLGLLPTPARGQRDRVGAFLARLAQTSRQFSTVARPGAATEGGLGRASGRRHRAAHGCMAALDWRRDDRPDHDLVVAMLAADPNRVFEPGEPDQKLRDLERPEDRLVELRDEISEAEPWIEHRGAMSTFALVRKLRP